MIIPATGEVTFSDGLRITAHSHVTTLFCPALTHLPFRPLPAKGWNQHELGLHPSEFGTFSVEVATNEEFRIHAAFISHEHEFYRKETPEDAERRAFHESIIATDLRGQREFSWGEAFCRVDRASNRDWIAIIYQSFANIPLNEHEIHRVLSEHDPLQEK